MSDDLWYDAYDADYEDYYHGQAPWDEEDVGEHSSTGLQEILESCVLPTTFDILFPLGKLFMSCIFIRLSIYLGKIL